MQVHIIHNQDRIDRKKILMQELEMQGITDYIFWDAIHDPHSAKYGINKAHKQIVEYAKENGLKEVLIFEDDIQFFDEGAFDYYLSNTPLSYDIYLGGIFLGELLPNSKVERFTGMTCYMVNERFYDTFLNTDPYEHIDISLAEKGEYYVCDPFICKQHNGYSQNEGKYANYDFMFENRKVFKKELILNYQN